MDVEEIVPRNHSRTGAGDVNGDGTPGLAVSAGLRDGPRMTTIFDGKMLTTTRIKPLKDYFAFECSLRKGAYVTIGNLDGDNFGDLFFGAGPGGAPRVLIVSSQH